MFPIEPQPGETDDRGLFLVQDPRITSKVLPLFSFDSQNSEERPIGHGTAFRIDLWSRCATAFHVIEDLLELDASGASFKLRSERELVALELGGDAYGCAPMPGSGWRPLAGLHSLAAVEQPPLAAARMRNGTELAVLRIRPPAPLPNGTPFFPMDLRRWRPQLGEQVLALGFAKLDRPDESDNDSRPIEQYLYGSLGEIVDIERADPNRMRPWPVIRVRANWPGGMSGGPVFNEAGNVIGIVSAGIDGHQTGTATFFSGWDIPRRVFGSLDPINPGRFFCYGAFDARGVLVRCGQDRRAIMHYARGNGLTDLCAVSVDPVTEEYTRI